eukprot:356015-Chlamydomonas_euryale.AAC.3
MKETALGRAREGAVVAVAVFERALFFCPAGPGREQQWQLLSLRGPFSSARQGQGGSSSGSCCLWENPSPQPSPANSNEAVGVCGSTLPICPCLPSAKKQWLFVGGPIPNAPAHIWSNGGRLMRSTCSTRQRRTSATVLGLWHRRPPFGSDAPQQQSLGSGIDVPPFGSDAPQQQSLGSGNDVPPFGSNAPQQQSLGSGNDVPPFGSDAPQQQSLGSGNDVPPPLAAPLKTQRETNITKQLSPR